jgi:hypothetical protein
MKSMEITLLVALLEAENRFRKVMTNIEEQNVSEQLPIPNGNKPQAKGSQDHIGGQRNDNPKPRDVSGGSVY